MRSVLTVTDLLIVGHPIVVSAVSAVILAGVLYVIVKARPTFRVTVVLIAAGYALWITWRVQEETWLGASLLRMAERDAEFKVSQPEQKFESVVGTGTGTNTEANKPAHATGKPAPDR